MGLLGLWQDGNLGAGEQPFQDGQSFVIVDIRVIGLVAGSLRAAQLRRRNFDPHTRILTRQGRQDLMQQPEIQGSEKVAIRVDGLTDAVLPHSGNGEWIGCLHRLPESCAKTSSRTVELTPQSDQARVTGGKLDKTIRF